MKINKTAKLKFLNVGKSGQIYIITLQVIQESFHRYGQISFVNICDRGNYFGVNVKLTSVLRLYILLFLSK